MEDFNPENFIVLVVDDIPQNLKVLTATLIKEGYKINFANNGKQALERIKNLIPDLILLDLMMPEMGGLQVCHILRENLKYDDIPIIFLTASQEENHFNQAFEVGATDYVTKPFKTPELLARVKTQLQLKHAKEKIKFLEAELNKLRMMNDE